MDLHPMSVFSIDDEYKKLKDLGWGSSGSDGNTRDNDGNTGTTGNNGDSVSNIYDYVRLHLNDPIFTDPLSKLERKSIDRI